MTSEEALHLFGQAKTRDRFSLSDMRKLLELLGNPDQTLRFVHIAGTNGKGSVCAMTASILKAAGFCTGLYISPSIDHFNERIQVNGEEIPDDELRRCAERVKNACKTMKLYPIDFVLTTAIAFLYFAQKKCDIVVLEVGLGGALDCTNVIDPPVVSAITHIGLEHTEILGKTREEIAMQKAGIIKRGSAVVACRQSKEVLLVIRQQFKLVNNLTEYDLPPLEEASPDVVAARKVNAISEQTFQEIASGSEQACPSVPPLICTTPSKVQARSRSLDGQTFIYPPFSMQMLTLSLAGSYQIENALVVLEIIHCLREKGYPITDSDVQTGFLSTVWPGRFEVLKKAPPVILDGAHNPNGALALRTSLEVYFPEQKLILVMGVMADKDYTAMVRIMAPLAACFIAEARPSSRALSAEALTAEIRRDFFGPVYTAPSIHNSIELALSKQAEAGLPVIFFGTLHQVAEIRNYFKNHLKN
ncbi:MAG: folylpolyglutamate synthase/dihydrofolate synthase family protein [Oribacterium sp.]|nr:folylpolyglutamate synthase/dihydrofolate synthase family protein [Oribacterium sp.]